MPIRYTLRDDGAFVRIKAEGRCTSADLMGFLEKLRSDPKVKSDHVSLYDATRVSFDDLDLEDFNFIEAIELERKHSDKLVARKLAIVVKDPRVWVYAMRYQDSSGPIGEHTRIFTNILEATLWLKM